MKPTRAFPNLGKWFAQTLAFAAAYYCFAWLGGAAAVAQGLISGIWPAAGLALAIVWFRGYGLAPAIGLGSFLFVIFRGASVWAGAGVATANMLEAVLAVFLLRRSIHSARLFDRANHVFRFILWAGVVATTPCAALGVASLCWDGIARWDAFGLLTLLWWAGDLIGIVIVAPALLVWTQPAESAWTARERSEAWVAFAALLLCCGFIFGMGSAPLATGFPAAFPVLPVLTWIAFRLGQRATVTATLVACAFAVWGTLHGTGPFAERERPLLVLDSFMGVAAATGLVFVASVTERNQAEAAAHLSEARKTTIFDTAFDAILSIDRGGTVLEWNAAAEKLFGHRPDLAVGHSMDELIVPSELRKQYLAGLAEYLITGVGGLIGRPIELMARRADGQDVPVELVITRVPMTEPPVYTVIVHDLTRRKQAEAALRQSEERLRLLFENIRDYAIYMLDDQSRVTTWNSGAEQMKGYSQKDILGKPFATFFTPEDIRRGVPDQLLKRAAAQEQAAYEGWRIRKDGSRFWIQGIIRAMRDEAGKLIGFAKVAHDITELRRAAEAVRVSEAHFRALAEELPQLVWTARADGACDYLSPQWGRYTGIPEKKLLGVDGAIEQVHPDDRNLASTAWMRAVRTGDPPDVEFRIRGAGGEYHWFRVRAVPLRDPEGNVAKWVGVNTDIDDRRRAREILEEQVRERTARLRSALNAVEELLYTIAHDLRAPNRSLQGFAQMLQTEYGQQLDGRARDYLDRISDAAVRNDELIRHLLEYGRLSHEPVRLASVDTRQAVEAVLQALEEPIKQRRAHICLGKEWPRALACEPLLRQVLTNLLSNAITYVPPGREPEVTVSAESRADRTVLCVKDNGIGIPPGQMDNLFRPFYRLPNSLNVPGTGIGLAIAKKAVERMNGRVKVESTAETGACFYVELPAR